MSRFDNVGASAVKPPPYLQIKKSQPTKVHSAAVEFESYKAWMGGMLLQHYQLYCDRKGIPFQSPPGGLPWPAPEMYTPGMSRRWPTGTSTPS